MKYALYFNETASFMHWRYVGKICSLLRLMHIILNRKSVKNTKHPQKHIFIAHSLQRQDLCFDHTILRSSRIHRTCWLGTVLPSVGSLTCSLYSCFETAEPHALYIHDLVAVLNTWLVEMVAAAGKTRLHEKCWNGYTKSGTHLNKKGVRVNTCVRVKKQTKSGK